MGYFSVLLPTPGEDPYYVFTEEDKENIANGMPVSETKKYLDEVFTTGKYKVVNMNYMFYDLKQSILTSIDNLEVYNWDTSNVTDMSYMFYGDYLITSLDLSNWDTSNVTDMSYMFSECRDLTSLDLSNWDTSNVTNMSWMFGGNNYYNDLTTVTGIIDMSKVSDYNYMLQGTSKLQSINIKLPGTGLNKTDEEEFKTTSKVSDTTNVNFIYDNWNLNINYDADAEYLYKIVLYASDPSIAEINPSSGIKVYKGKSATFRIRLNNPEYRFERIETVSGTFSPDRTQNIEEDGSYILTFNNITDNAELRVIFSRLAAS